MKVTIFSHVIFDEVLIADNKEIKDVFYYRKVLIFENISSIFIWPKTNPD